eukprot:CAMPEP_0180265660 /NCGR_PEP_ID=MMETSP0988-20121125/579_1 /TAXON_ID=697907 /ORGANISM="non described non described, Strain CCMP2293" /LENGTH=218 /DNA_ID=CAMNT_0022236177 /DNA_START=185 /DNA_END=837 /DNA_ORIENTATION=-
MAFAPMGDVLWCRRNKSLGKINADVFPILFGNGIGWVVYGIFSDNFYMVAGCASYFVAGIFYIHTGYSLSTSDAARRRIEVATLSIMGVWLVLWVTAIQTSHKVLRNNVIGTAATVTQLLLFASPLSTMAKVIRVKSAASINTFFASIGALCSMLWIVDGFVLDDFYLYAPKQTYSRWPSGFRSSCFPRYTDPSRSPKGQIQASWKQAAFGSTGVLLT